MKTKLIKTTIVVALIYAIAFILTLYYRSTPQEVERYHLLLVLFLPLTIGAIYLEEHFLKLFILLLLPLFIGIGLYAFVIIDLLDYTCAICGQGSCGHTKIECDGPCYGWYTFENEPMWISTQYFFNWFFGVFLVYFLKGFKWMVAKVKR